MSVGNEPLLDDAVTDSTANHVGVASTVVSANVGVRIDHPRESDLVLTLVEPGGDAGAAGGEPRGAGHQRVWDGGEHHQFHWRRRRAGRITGEHERDRRGDEPGTLLINYNFFQPFRMICGCITTGRGSLIRGW